MSKNFFRNVEWCPKADEETINNYKDLFIEYGKNLPTLREALLHLYNSSGLSSEKTNEYINDIIETTKHKLEFNNLYNDKI